LAILRAQMVNGGFPTRRHYGFELVDAEQARRRATISRQSKIYGESNRPNSSRFFGELSPKQSLAIYRQALGEKRRRIDARRLEGRSRERKDVLSIADGILARAGARAVAEGQNA
jgi:hypothetical protein